MLALLWIPCGIFKCLVRYKQPIFHANNARLRADYTKVFTAVLRIVYAADRDQLMGDPRSKDRRLYCEYLLEFDPPSHLSQFVLTVPRFDFCLADTLFHPLRRLIRSQTPEYRELGEVQPPVLYLPMGPPAPVIGRAPGPNFETDSIGMARREDGS